MGVRDRHRRRNAFRPAVLSVAAVTLVHLLARTVAAALLSVSICGFPSGGAQLVDQLLLDRLESPGHVSPAKVRDIPEIANGLPLQ
jgi:hypothetical protein